MKLSVLVVGAGMYVCGRGTDGYGTVLPALFEASRRGLVGRILIATTKQSSIKIIKKKADELSKIMGVNPEIECLPSKQDDPESYIKVLNHGNPDCAIVVVPDDQHGEITKKVMARRVHALVVKPLAPTVKEGQEMAEAARKHGVYGMVEFHKRFDEANLKLKDLITDGRLGEILNVTVNYSQRKMVPTKLFKKWAAKTDIFQYLGVHYADIVYFVTGAKPLRVMALGQKNFLVKKKINTYDAIEVFIEWEDPKTKKTFVSAIITNWIDPDTTSSMSDQTISVVGTKGRYDSDQKNRGVQIVTDDNGIEDFNPYFSQLYGNKGEAEFRGYGHRSVRQFLVDVANIIAGVSEPDDFELNRPTFDDALVSTAIIEAAKKSLNEKSNWVKV